MFVHFNIYVDENFNLENHIQHVYKKLNKSLFSLDRIKNSLNEIFYSHLLCGPSKLNCAKPIQYQKNPNSLKNAIRVIIHACYNAITAPLFYTKILPFDKVQVLELSKLLFMHSIHYNYNYPSFTDV